MSDRRFMLRPDAKLTALITWLLAVCAPVFGVEVHAVTVMSSHYHMVVSVADQQISDFFQSFNAHLAKAVNALRRARRGILWEPGKLGIVELKTVDAVVFQIAYAIVNPVAAGLCWSPEDWPGLSVQVDQIGRGVLRATRTGAYFTGACWADSGSLDIPLPACLRELGEDEARRVLEAEVQRQLAEARADIKKSGHRVLGAIAAKTAPPFRRAKTWETFGTLNPHFTTGPGRVGERVAAAEELVAFRQAYRAAWLRYREGELEVVFPYGCYLMRVRHHARVAPPPS